MHGIGYFYNAKMLEKISEPMEKDNGLVWLKIHDCYEKLFLEHQAWTVRQSVLLASFKLKRKTYGVL